MAAAAQAPYLMALARIPGRIEAENYDIGGQGIAYHDNDPQSNTGNRYRTAEGVDIEVCEDTGNGYNVGWTLNREWLAYTVSVDSSGIYDLRLRAATESFGTQFHFELDNRPLTAISAGVNTGGWQNWQDIVINDVVLEEGKHVLKLHFDANDLNTNYFEFYNFRSLEAAEFNIISAKTSQDGNQIIATFNKQLSGPLPASPAGFAVSVDQNNREIANYEIDTTGYQIILMLDEEIVSRDEVLLTYSGGEITAIDNSILTAFTDLLIENRVISAVPGKIEAEDFSLNMGFELENTTDTGGGQNLGFANNGDYVEYLLNVQHGGTYSVNYRVASAFNGGDIRTELISDDSTWVLHNVSFPLTGGWQTWTTVSSNASIPEGRFTLRIMVVSTKEFNLNWFSFDIITALDDQERIVNGFNLYQNYPNPFNPSTTISYALEKQSKVRLEIFNVLGQKVKTLVNQKQPAGQYKVNFAAQDLVSGVYLYRLKTADFVKTRKMILMK